MVTTLFDSKLERITIEIVEDDDLRIEIGSPGSAEHIDVSLQTAEALVPALQRAIDIFKAKQREVD